MGIINSIKRAFKKKVSGKKDIWGDEEYGITELVYTDNGGNKYYQLKDALAMSVKRHIAAEAALRAAEYCITKEDLIAFVDKMESAINKGQITEVARLIYEIRTRLLFSAEEKTLLELACVYFYLEDEPLSQYASYWQEKKRKLWEMDDAATDFFLQSAFRLTIQYSKLSDSDILTYLKSLKELVKKEGMSI